MFDRHSPRHVNPEDQASYTRVINTLGESIVDQSCFRLAIEGSRTQFTCRVAAINEMHGEFVIDGLNPALPKDLLTRDRSMTLTLAGDSCELVLESQYIEPLIENSNSAHQLRVPVKLTEVAPRQNVDLVLQDIESRPEFAAQKTPNRLN